MTAPARKIRRDGLIEDYREYVASLVMRLMRIMQLPYEHRDELTAAGYLGLVEAAERYDFSVGTDFKCYAFLRIRGAVIDCIRKYSQVSGAGYRYVKALQGAHELQVEATERDRNPTQTALNTRTQLEQMLEYAGRSAFAFRLSMTDAEAELQDKSVEQENVEHHITRREDHARLRQLVAKLPAKERFIIEQHYFCGRSFTDIATESCELSKSWISRLHSRALRLLKESYLSDEDE